MALCSCKDCLSLFILWTWLQFVGGSSTRASQIMKRFQCLYFFFVKLSFEDMMVRYNLFSGSPDSCQSVKLNTHTHICCCCCCSYIMLLSTTRLVNSISIFLQNLPVSSRVWAPLRSCFSSILLCQIQLLPCHFRVKPLPQNVSCLAFIPAPEGISFSSGICPRGTGSG